MRVLLIQSWLKVGGAEQLTIELADALRKKGHRVSIACGFVDRHFLNLRGLHVIQPWRWIAGLSSRSRFLYVVLGCPALFALVFLKARSYDLLNPHNFPSLWAAACASLFFGTPVVWHFNEPAPIPRLLLHIENLVSRRAQAITVLDERNRTKARALFNREAMVVRAGVDFPFWSNGDRRLAERTHGLSGRPSLLTVAKLHPQKNQVLLLEVLRILKADIPGLQLLLTGEGPDRKRLETRIQQLDLVEDVIFTGIVDARMLRSLYANAFLVCYPALDQTWGLTPFEALCQKTVSLVSSQCGVAEILGLHRLGLVAEADPSSFVEAIRFAYLQRDVINEMGERGFEFTRVHMSWERFAGEMLKVFEKAAQAPSRKVEVGEGISAD